jgi:hypothetical protein
MGCAAPEEEGAEETKDSVMLTFHDNDNDTVYCFPVQVSQVEQYINLIRQTMNRQKIEIAQEMPRGPHV